MSELDISLDPEILYTIALTRIEECQRLQLPSLNLSGLQLTKLPPEANLLTHLKELDISDNRISQLPQFWLFTELTNLNLSNNLLNTFHPEIFFSSNIELLDIHGNDLAVIPPKIAKLSKLTDLDLSSNQILKLPPEIGDLTQLRTLNLFDNRITELPVELFKCKQLTEINLGDNGLTNLPPEIGHFTALKTLDLASNDLTVLPKEVGRLTLLEDVLLYRNRLTAIGPELGMLKSLKRLDLDQNRLTALPREIGQLTSLTLLDLSSNSLTDLPPEISHLTALTHLFLQENPLLGIPDSIAGPSYIEVFATGKTAHRVQDILSFYFAQRDGAALGTLRSVSEIKVMLVGRGEAGKTSLRRFFMGQPHNKAEKETPGIALDSFKLTCSQGLVTVRLWDFAGQEITHALHQFFLTEGCVYVLVLDPRSNTEMQDAEYWLGLLKRYAGGAPVLVVLNRQDARKGGYDVDRRMLQERFPFIRSFTQTNCEKRESCSELRQRLCDAVESLKETEPPHLKVPESWLEVMKDCSGQQSKPLGHDAASKKNIRQHLTIDEFREICALNGETDGAKQESLARLLHKLGAVLHFVDEPRLRDTTVLSPHWVTDGVYRLLRFKDRVGTDGTLTLTDALQALPGEKEKEARFLLRLMERFEMCFPLDQEDVGGLPDKWFIPGALGEFQPEGVTAEWQKPGGVRLRYIYDPLPEGVIPRFIVMTNLLSEEKPRWRNGVILEDGRAVALVRRGEKRNHVEVTAFGPEEERLRLLEIIQGNFERIHSDLPDPKPTAELELIGLPGIFRNLAELEAAEKRNVPVTVKTVDIEAQVDPTPQLDQTSERAVRAQDRLPLNAFLSYSHEDRKAKSIFQLNLTVMMKKKYIAPWHDGLIEPGMRWRQEIEENLEKMDVFVGLLTNSFLVSDFIEKVEIKAARKKMAEQGKEFLFILILVDDISLEGLDLSEYQILKPGGKAVCSHTSRKRGFNLAQAELERILIRRQGEKKQDKKHSSNMQPRSGRSHGVTIFVQGDYVKGNKPMNHDQSIHIGGNIINSQIGQTLTNCNNLIMQEAPGDRKVLLQELSSHVEKLIKALPLEKQDKAPKIARDLKVLVEQSTSSEPEREWYWLSAKGLLEAATWVKDMSGEIGGTVKNLGKAIWADFLLPGAE